MRIEDELTCREIVELITDFLEDAMPAEERTMFEEHLVFCVPCVNYLGQVRHTVELVGGLREEDLSGEARGALLEAFRGWKAERR
jgi:Putative zinc-finger